MRQISLLQGACSPLGMTFIGLAERLLSLLVYSPQQWVECLIGVEWVETSWSHSGMINKLTQGICEDVHFTCGNL